MKAQEKKRLFLPCSRNKKALSFKSGDQRVTSKNFFCLIFIRSSFEDFKIAMPRGTAFDHMQTQVGLFFPLIFPQISPLIIR